MISLRTRTVSLLSITAIVSISRSAGAQVTGDFDNDGFADLAIGVPGESFNSELSAGVVNVIYGSAARLDAADAQLWHLDRTGIPGDADIGDELGRTLAVGDFNGDGVDDLAVGIPGRTIGGEPDAGAVLIIHGTGAGLAAINAQLWHQDVAGVLNGAEWTDRFGNALASGDFNGDGFDDLAIGAPGEDGDSGLDVGGVSILYGAPGGLNADGDQFIQQDSNGINATAEGNDHFGETLAAGDFNNDGRDELVIGVPDESFNGEDEAGLVHVLFGTVGGLVTAGAQTWHQDSNNIPEAAEEDDNFGASLAIGDFDNDGFDDLAVGVPQESVGAINDAGGMLVLRGGAGGLSATGVKFWTQNTANLIDDPQLGDRFGQSLAAADFNGDGFVDLSIGVAGEKIGPIAEAGAVQLLLGSINGLRGNASQFWNQDSSGVLDRCEHEDRFGATLGAGDFDGDGLADLAVGIPYEDIGDTDAGAVAVLYGANNGLRAGPDQFWHQDVAGVPDTCDPDDGFGAANVD